MYTELSNCLQLKEPILEDFYGEINKTQKKRITKQNL